MANYTGSECKYCGKTFADGDDIVVCPECGTPYHRDCYFEAGECVNKPLHDNGGSWAPETKAGEDSTEEKRCPRCGESNPPSGLFCVKCGMPLHGSQGEPRPFNDGYQRNGQHYGGQQGGAYGTSQPNFGMPYQEQITKDTDVEGHTVREYAGFIGSNPYYFLLQFIRFARTHTKISLNFGALVFTEFYYFYRKMYLKGVVFMVLLTLLSIPDILLRVSEGMIPNVALPQALAGYKTQIEAATYLCYMAIVAIRIFSAAMANYWYYKKAKGTLDAAKKQDITDEERDSAVAACGGTSAKALIVSLTVYVAVLTFLLMGIVSL